MTTMSRSNNIIKALHDRQRGIRNEALEPILKQSAENIIMRKAYLRDYSVYTFNLNRDVRTTFLTVFSPDGKRVACAHGDRSISIISMDTKKVERVLSGGHIRSLWALSWAPVAGTSDYIIASGCLGGHVHLWFNEDHPTISQNFHKPIASLSFHPKTSILAMAVDNTLMFWDIRDGDTPQTILSLEDDETKFRYVSYDNVGKYLVTGVRYWDFDLVEHMLESRTYTIEVWELSEQGILTNLDPKNSRIIVQNSTLHNDSSVAIDANFTMLATTVSMAGEFVNVYSLKPHDFGTILHSIRSTWGVIISVSFSPSLRYLIVGHNTTSDSSMMSIIRIDGAKCVDTRYKVPEVLLHRFALREISDIKTLTGAINECIQDYVLNQANLVCLCAKKRSAVLHEISRCNLTCSWFLDYVRAIDTSLSRCVDLVTHNVEFKSLIQRMKKKYRLCHRLTNEVLSEQTQFCMEVQDFLSHNLRKCEIQPIVKLNCLCWSPDIDNGILASFNNGRIIMLK